MIFDRRTLPFTQLDAAGQDAVLLAWQQSRLRIRRTGYAALHGLCAAAYYASPETYGLVGYPGPPDYGNFVPAAGGMR